MRWLLLLFVVLPIVDLVGLVWLGDHWGFVPTVVLALLGVVLGVAAARREGLRVLRSFRAALEEGQPAEHGIVDGLLVLVAAALLIMPGVLSDLVGLVLLVPVTRRPIAVRIRAGLDRRLETAQIRVVSADFVASADPGSKPEFDVVTTVGESLDEPEQKPRPRLPKPP